MEYTACQKNVMGQRSEYEMHCGYKLDERNPNCPQVVARESNAFKYGFRGKNKRVLYLSPYEFTSEWDIQRVLLPINLGAPLQPLPWLFVGSGLALTVRQWKQAYSARTGG